MTATTVTMSFSDIEKRYNQLQAEALTIDFVVRDSQLQEDKLVELRAFRDVLKNAKRVAIDARDEKRANTIFLFQCMINALSSSLTVWLKIKAGQASDAWCALVDAQDYTSIAMRIPVPRAASSMEGYARRLQQVEVTIFPAWPMFISPGFLEEGSGICSICGSLYNCCDDHLEGLVYAGRLCERLRRNFQTDHTALVTAPHDKRCVIRYIATPDGRKRDYITLKVSDDRFESASVGAEESSGLQVDVVLLTTKRLDVD